MDNSVIKRSADARYTDEYGCTFRRLLPWNNTGSSDEGMAIAQIQPQTQTSPHSHDQVEYFYIINGKGTLFLDDTPIDVVEGDVIQSLPNTYHTIKNTSDNEELKVMCIWRLNEGS